MTTGNIQKWAKRIIGYGMLAVGLFFLLTGAKRQGAQEPISVPYLMMGDSVYGECRDETSIPALLSEKLGGRVYNGALGGTCMGRFDTEMRLANTKDCLSMHALSASIVTGDFGVQQTVRSRESVTEYFEQTINELECIDFEQVEILFIGHGVNDYHCGTPIYDEEDIRNPYTFTGALRSIVETLREKYPDLRIILLTPTYTWYPYKDLPELTCEEYNLGGGVLEEYVNAEIALAGSLGVEVLDLYHDLYPHENWSDWQIYSRDGLHPNAEGNKLIADRIYQYLQDTK